jgi:hypothetical protein
MPITDRVAQLRRQSLEAVPTLSCERARLMTEFYKTTTELASTPVKRARSFYYLMDHKTISIQPGELIVGEKGPAPKATPTYPELCCHSLTDLDLLNSRPKIPFNVDAATRTEYEKEIIPFWQGKSMRERIFAEMTDEWKAAYEAGIFTEFMEQRAPGHTVLDDKIYHKGMLDFIKDIHAALAGLDFLNWPPAWPSSKPIRFAKLNLSKLPLFVSRFQLTPRIPSGKRCSITGLFIWV